MSRNSKYDRLPGIAHDQPDVYETTGSLDEDIANISKFSNENNKFVKPDMSNIFLETEGLNENISVINIKPKDAFNKFKDKYVPQNSLNENQYTYEKFGNLNKESYISNFEETPLQKFERIKEEINELSSQLKFVDESKCVGGFNTDLKPKDILDNLNILENQLTSLRITESNENFIFGENYFEELENKLKNFNEPINEVEHLTCEDNQKNVTYQLFYNPILTKITQMSKNQILEQRIRNLENLVGTDINQLEKIPNLSTNKSILETIHILSSKVSQLDPNHLEQIDSRLSSILHKFNQLNEKKNEFLDIEKQNKINELYDHVNSSKQYSSSIPLILSRLNNLEELQQQAIHFSKAFSFIDNLQTQIHNILENNEEKLNALKELFSLNIDSIKIILSKMDKRISNLK